mmetsp:Transcript_37113/g.81369  ORF Transcript_37113/g.81369 Transcript_37113/m.81369 type:complete len:287 (-) Transcript_37113:126-986(-)
MSSRRRQRRRGGGGGGGVGVGGAKRALSQRKGSLGSRLGAMKHPPSSHGKSSSAVRTKIMTMGSSAAAAAAAGGSVGPPQKRQRTSIAAGSTSDGSDEGSAPPPSALNFLAALNNPGAVAAGAATAAAVAAEPPPPGIPPLHQASSSSFPGATAGRSQPKPKAAKKKVVRKQKQQQQQQQQQPQVSGDAADGASEGGKATRSQRKGRGGCPTTASNSDKNTNERAFEVGDDVLVQWNDGNQYAAIVKDSTAVDGSMWYNVEFDNGEIEDVKSDDIISPSDVEDMSE